jgi:hypothetical protein
MLLRWRKGSTVGDWNEDFLQRLRKKINEFKRQHVALEKQIKEVLEEEVDNFLFVASGDNCIIKGMHYPESAFSDGEVPLIWKSSEKGVYIAAWPQDKIRELLLKVELDNPEEIWESEWNKVLQGLMEESINKLENAKEVTE